MRIESRQQGFLLIAAIVLVVVLSFFALVITDLFVSDTRDATYRLASSQALFLAESGLQRATRAVLSPTVLTPSSPDNRQSCATMNTNITNVPLGAGVFSVTGGNPFYSGDSTHSAMTLNGPLGAAASVIPLSNTGSIADYAPAGRVMIDQEAMDYSAISQSATVCGTAPCLVGAVRGVDGTQAVAHDGGAPIGQYQCPIQSRGGVPALANARGARTLGAGVALQEAWVVGSQQNGVSTLLRWSGAQWVDASTQIPPSISSQGFDLDGVTCLNNADCWMVGSLMQGVGVAAEWNGAQWIDFSTLLPPAVQNNNLDLDSVSCTAFDDCWIAGSLAAKRFTALYWNGSTWTNETATALNQLRVQTGQKFKKRDVDSVACVPNGTGSVECWFVGSFTQGSTTVVQLLWDVGTQTGTWRDFSGQLKPSLRNNDLDAVTCSSAASCWAVGSANWGQSALAYWNGSSWGKVASPPGTLDVESIACPDAGACWAAGSWTGGSTLLYWNGTAWSDQSGSVPGSISSQGFDLDGLACGNRSDCWAIGSFIAGATIAMHWDGVQWTDFSAAMPNGNDVEGIALIGPHARPRSAWVEVFP